MDQDVTQALDRVTQAVQDSTRATEAATRAANTATEAIGVLRREVSNVSNKVDDLARFVGHNGSKPPPGAPPLDELAASAHRKASDASLDVAALHGQMIAGFSEVKAELARQSSAMGIGLRGLRWLVSSEGRTTVVRLATLAGMAYLALTAAMHR